MSNNTRRQALQAAGLAYPRPDAVTAPLFHSGEPFFFAMDKVQVKHEGCGRISPTVTRSPRPRPRMATPEPSLPGWPPRSSAPG